MNSRKGAKTQRIEKNHIEMRLMRHHSEILQMLYFIFAFLRLCVSSFTRHGLFASCLRGALFLLVVFFGSPLSAMDHVTFRRDGKTREVTGRVLISAQDGGLLLLAQDGVLWLIPPEEKVEHTTDAAPFTPLSREEIGKRILLELPPDFKIHATAHYLIFYDTSPAYAQWCGALFERLYMAFTNAWIRKDFKLTEPEFPLVAIVFADKDSYRKFTQSDLGEAGDAIIGYFGLLSNRMTMYDLTGLQPQGRRHGKTTAQINQILNQPEALRTVSTIVHEATHQIAFNCGLHARLSDCPRWFSEGIAMFFETPDLRSAKGWKGIGNLNQARLVQFSKYMATRPANSLETLICDDKRLTDAKLASDAYAEAWALTYFLIYQHPKEYISYLRSLSAKKPLVQDTPRQRVDEFRRFFGDLSQLDAEFLRYMARR
jgi:hypothetical protein